MIADEQLFAERAEQAADHCRALRMIETASVTPTPTTCLHAGSPSCRGKPEWALGENEPGRSPRVKPSFRMACLPPSAVHRASFGQMALTDIERAIMPGAVSPDRGAKNKPSLGELLEFPSQREPDHCAAMTAAQKRHPSSRPARQGPRLRVVD
jgi:hypothetical protein